MGYLPGVEGDDEQVDCPRIIYRVDKINESSGAYGKWREWEDGCLTFAWLGLDDNVSDMKINKQLSLKFIMMPIKLARFVSYRGSTKSHYFMSWKDGA